MECGTSPPHFQLSRKPTKVERKSTTKKPIRVSTPLFIPATSGSVLAKRMKAEEEKMADIVVWKFKVVEKGGRKLRDLLTKSNLFGKEKCGRTKCVACSNGAKPQEC